MSVELRCYLQYWQGIGVGKSIDSKSRDANQRTPTTSETPTTAGPEMPATTGTHEDLRILFFLS
jgi:hypothetical protein